LNVNHIADGTPLAARVVRVEVSSKVVDLTLRHPSRHTEDKSQKSLSDPAFALRGIAVGAIIPCKVTRVIPGAALLLSLAPHIQGRISVIDVSDQLLANPFASFSVGDVIDALVTDIEASDLPIVSCCAFYEVDTLIFIVICRFILHAASRN
jgi:ribosomal protein S1